MAMMCMTWEEFLKDLEHFKSIADLIGDRWTIVKKDSEIGNTYLVSKRQVEVSFSELDKCADPDPEQSDLDDGILGSETDIGICDPCVYYPEEFKTMELVNLEYHVVYSTSYQVPVLFFKGYRRNGEYIDLEDAWKVFKNSSPNMEKCKKLDMFSTLTQFDHPVLFVPLLALHPCRTAEVLANTPKSKNRILTFLSIFGPYLGLHLKEQYAKYVND